MALRLSRMGFTILSTASVSQVLLLDSNMHILGIHILGTWTSASIGFVAYRWGSGTNDDNVYFDSQASPPAWANGPFSSTAAFDTVYDNAAVPFMLNKNATPITTAAFHVFGSGPGFGLLKGIMWYKVSSVTAATGAALVAQGQNVNGFVLMAEQQ